MPKSTIVEAEGVPSHTRSMSWRSTSTPPRWVGPTIPIEARRIGAPLRRSAARNRDGRSSNRRRGRSCHRREATGSRCEMLAPRSICADDLQRLCATRFTTFRSDIRSRDRGPADERIRRCRIRRVRSHERDHCRQIRPHWLCTHPYHGWGAYSHPSNQTNGYNRQSHSSHLNRLI